MPIFTIPRIVEYNPREFNALIDEIASRLGRVGQIARVAAWLDGWKEMDPTELVGMHRFCAKDFRRDVNRLARTKLLCIDTAGNIIIAGTNVVVKNFRNVDEVRVRFKHGRSAIVDRGIAPMIKFLNDHGFKTDACCSGMVADHPNDIEKREYRGKPVIAGKVVAFDTRKTIAGRASYLAYVVFNDRMKKGRMDAIKHAAMKAGLLIATVREGKYLSIEFPFDIDPDSSVPLISPSDEAIALKFKEFMAGIVSFHHGSWYRPCMS